MEALSGVHQIKVPFPKGLSGSTNAYVIEGERGNILIDSGWDTPEALWALREGLKADNLKLQDIKTIVITHIHPDHYGLAGKVKQICGAKVAMHSAEAELIASRYSKFDELLDSVANDLSRNGVPQDELLNLKNASLWMKDFVTCEQPDIMLKDGDRISNGTVEIQVIRTPGHSPGHICLYEPRRRLLFSGDHVLYETNPVVGYNPQSGNDPLGDYLSALRKLDNFKTSFVFPGHGPVFNGLGLRVGRIIGLNEERKKEIMRALDSGLKTAYQIAREVGRRGGGVAFDSLNSWDKRTAVMESLAHLRLLVKEGSVGSVEMDSVLFYVSTK
jgi:glyoxylase-like metal-dependent hydrolase (beta-lactamase superfamily II)